MDLGLGDRVVLVAGSSRGIGKAVARTFATEGARVVLTAREAGPLAAAEEEIAATTSRDRVLSMAADMTTAADIHRVQVAVRERWGVPDVVVANVGSGRGRTGWDVSDEDWDAMLEVNLRGTVRLATAFLPGLVARGSGNIVVIGSIAGLEAIGAPVHYAAAKSALGIWTKTVARQVGPSGVRVNCVSPGNVWFEGGTWDRKRREAPAEVARLLETEVPLRRFGTPDEIGALVAFLASDRAGFVTGACVVADGGQTRAI